MLILIADKRSILQLTNKYKINEWNCQCEYSTNITLNEAAQYKWIRQTNSYNDDEWWWWRWKKYNNYNETMSSKHGNL